MQDNNDPFKEFGGQAIEETTSSDPFAEFGGKAIDPTPEKKNPIVPLRGLGGSSDLSVPSPLSASATPPKKTFGEGALETVRTPEPKKRIPVPPKPIEGLEKQEAVSYGDKLAEDIVEGAMNRPYELAKTAQQQIDSGDYVVNGKKVTEYEARKNLLDRGFVAEVNSQLREGTFQSSGILKLGKNANPETIALANHQIKSQGEFDEFKSLQAGLMGLNIGLTNMPNYLNSMMEQATGIPNAFFTTFMSVSPDMKQMAVSGEAKERLTKYVANLNKIKEGYSESKFKTDDPRAEKQSDFIDLFNQGKYGELGRTVVNSTLESAPIMVASAAAAAVTGNPMAGAMFLVPQSASTRAAEIDNSKDQKVKDLTPGEKLADANISGMAEGIPEAFMGPVVNKSFKLFKQGVQESIKRVFEEKGKDAAIATAEGAAKETAAQLIKNYGKELALGYGEEAATSTVTEFKDVYLGTSNKTFSEILRTINNDGMIGSLSQGLISTPGTGIALANKAALNGRRLFDKKVSTPEGQEDLKEFSKQYAQKNGKSEEEVVASIDARIKAVNAVPKRLVDDTKTIDLVQEKQDLTEQMRNLDDAFKKPLADRIAKIDEEIAYRAERNEFIKKREALVGEIDGITDAPDGIKKAYQDFEEGKEVPLQDLQKASDWAYSELKRMRAMKGSPTSELSQERVDDYIDLLTRDVSAFEDKISELKNAEAEFLTEPVINSTPTDEKYASVNNNDGKGTVDLTKQEYLDWKAKQESVTEQLPISKTEQNAKEQQSEQMRSQSIEGQPQGESDSNMSIVNQTELQDRQTPKEEVAPTVVTEEVAVQEPEPTKPFVESFGTPVEDLNDVSEGVMQTNLNGVDVLFSEVDGNTVKLESIETPEGKSNREDDNRETSFGTPYLVIDNPRYLARGGKSPKITDGYYTASKDEAISYADGNENNVAEVEIDDSAKILYIVDGDYNNYEENEDGKRLFKEITGIDYSVEEFSDLNNNSTKKKLREAGYDAVVGSTIDGLSTFVLNKDVLTPLTNQRNQGKAKKALQKIIDKADELGKTIVLSVVPKDENTTEEGLRKLYEGFGFVATEGKNMERVPNAEVKGTKAEVVATEKPLSLAERLNAAKRKVEKESPIARGLYLTQLYNRIGKRMRKDVMGNKIFGELRDLAKENGWEVVFQKTGSVRITDKNGKEIRATPVFKAKEEKKESGQARRESKQYRGEILNMRPQTIEHFIAMALAGGTRFSKSQINRAVGRDSDIPSWMWADKGVSLEFLADTMRDAGFGMDTEAEVDIDKIIDAVKLFATRNGRNDAFDFAEEVYNAGNKEDVPPGMEGATEAEWEERNAYMERNAFKQSEEDIPVILSIDELTEEEAARILAEMQAQGEYESSEQYKKDLTKYIKQNGKASTGKTNVSQTETRDDVSKSKAERTEVEIPTEGLTPNYTETSSVAEKYKDGIYATFKTEGGEIPLMAKGAWRSMGIKEFLGLLNGNKYDSKENKKGNYFSSYPAYSANVIGKGKILIEFGEKQADGETLTSTAGRNDITGVWQHNGKDWVKLSPKQIEKLFIEQNQPQSEKTKAPEQASLFEDEKSELAKRIRDRKVKGLTFFDPTLGLIGISVKIYNAALDIAAKEVQNGTEIGKAIQKAVEYIDKAMQGAKWNKDIFDKAVRNQWTQALLKSPELFEELKSFAKTYAENTKLEPSSKGFRRYLKDKQGVNIDQEAASYVFNSISEGIPKKEAPKQTSKEDLAKAKKEEREKAAARLEKAKKEASEKAAKAREAAKESKEKAVEKAIEKAKQKYVNIGARIGQAFGNLEGQIAGKAKGIKEAAQMQKWFTQQVNTILEDMIAEAKESNPGFSIAPRQLAAITKKLLSVNPFSQNSFAKAVEYMDKVLEDATYIDKMDNIAAAQKAVKKRKHPAFQSAVNQFLSIKPEMIPDALVEPYMKALKDMDARVPSYRAMQDMFFDIMQNIPNKKPEYDAATELTSAETLFDKILEASETVSSVGDYMKLLKDIQKWRAKANRILTMEDDPKLNEAYETLVDRIDAIQEQYETKYKDAIAEMKAIRVDYILSKIKELDPYKNPSGYNDLNLSEEAKTALKQLSDMGIDGINQMTFEEITTLGDILDLVQQDGYTDLSRLAPILSSAIARQNAEKIAQQVEKAKDIENIKKLQSDLSRVDSAFREGVMGLGRAKYGAFYNRLIAPMQRASAKHFNFVNSGRKVFNNKKKELNLNEKNMDRIGMVMFYLREHALSFDPKFQDKSDEKNGKYGFRDWFHDILQNNKANYGISSADNLKRKAGIEFIGNKNKYFRMKDAFDSLPKNAEGKVDVKAVYESFKNGSNEYLSKKEMTFLKDILEWESNNIVGKQRAANEMRGKSFDEIMFHILRKRTPKLRSIEVEPAQTVLTDKNRVKLASDSGKAVTSEKIEPIEFNFEELFDVNLNEVSRDYFYTPALMEFNKTVNEVKKRISDSKKAIMDVAAWDMQESLAHELTFGSSNKTVRNILGAQAMQVFINPIRTVVELASSLSSYPLRARISYANAVNSMFADTKMVQDLLTFTSSPLMNKENLQKHFELERGQIKEKALFTRLTHAMAGAPERVLLKPIWYGRFQVEFFNRTGERFSPTEYANPRYKEKYRQEILDAASAADAEYQKIAGSATGIGTRRTAKILPDFIGKEIGIKKGGDIDVKSNAGLLFTFMTGYQSRELEQVIEGLKSIKEITKEQGVLSKDNAWALGILGGAVIGTLTYTYLSQMNYIMQRLLLPGENDDEEEIKKELESLSKFDGKQIATSLTSLSATRYNGLGRQLLKAFGSLWYNMTDDEARKKEIKALIRNFTFQNPYDIDRYGSDKGNMAESISEAIPVLSIMINNFAKATRNYRDVKKAIQKVEDGTPLSEMDKENLLMMKFMVSVINATGQFAGANIPTTTMDRTINNYVSENRPEAEIRAEAREKAVNKKKQELLSEIKSKNEFITNQDVMDLNAVFSEMNKLGLGEFTSKEIKEIRSDVKLEHTIQVFEKKAEAIEGLSEIALSTNKKKFNNGETIAENYILAHPKDVKIDPKTLELLGKVLSSEEKRDLTSTFTKLKAIKK